MTKYIDGKRYRITVDASYDAKTRTFRRDETLIMRLDNEFARKHATVELLPDPLPTTPDSVVLDVAKMCWQLMDDGRWFMAGNKDGLSPGHMGEYAPFTVLFDAGTER